MSTDRPEGLDDDRHPLEVLLADPAGRVSVYLGAVGNGRVDLASDLIARTGTAAEISASKRLFGLVEGQLLWVWELAAFGEPLQSYASAKLSRRPAA
ncbi:FABP family protein [Cellulosimicrobium sp. CUA-896]|uniref:FABP family protein n=1 Tax=Cellulosimicrobium sp. CUA-896 TaxID=1517881 RepID=UPI00351265D3